MSETAEPETVQNRKWCEKMFDRLPFVEWDRLVVGNVITDSQAITAHGWIDRDDGHEDFVVMILWTADRTVFAHTSSPEYSAEISQRLFGDTDDHNDCRPIEDTLNVSPSRSPSFMDSARYDLLVPQATSTRQCPKTPCDRKRYHSPLAFPGRLNAVSQAGSSPVHRRWSGSDRRCRESRARLARGVPRSGRSPLR